MNIDILPDYITDLTDYLAGCNAQTGIDVVQVVSAGELSRMVAPSIGVFFTTPLPNPANIALQGEIAVYDWRIMIVVASQKTFTKTDGLKYCFSKSRLIKSCIEFHPSRDFWEMRLDTAQPFTIYDNTASSTITAIHYVINCPF